MFSGISISIFKFINERHWCQFSLKDEGLRHHRILSGCNYNCSINKIYPWPLEVSEVEIPTYQPLILVLPNGGISYFSGKYNLIPEVALDFNCPQTVFMPFGLQVTGCFSPGGMFIIHRVFDLPLPLFADKIFRKKISWKQCREWSREELS